MNPGHSNSPWYFPASCHKYTWSYCQHLLITSINKTPIYGCLLLRQLFIHKNIFFLYLCASSSSLSSSSSTLVVPASTFLLLPLLVHLYLTPGKQASTFHSIDSSNECVDRRAKKLEKLMNEIASAGPSVHVLLKLFFKKTKDVFKRNNTRYQLRPYNAKSNINIVLQHTITRPAQCCLGNSLKSLG